LSRLLLLTLALTLATPALAQGREAMGTVIIEQVGGIAPGNFGLIKPGNLAPIESNSRSLTLENQSPGIYTLTITPPAGASFVTTVTHDSEVKEVSESRTVHEELTAGGRLSFSIAYVIDRVGVIVITFFNSRSESVSVPFTLNGPYGEATGRTPATFDNMPEGTYHVLFDLHAVGCPLNPAPLAKLLRKRERLSFNAKSACAALLKEEPEVTQEEEETGAEGEEEFPGIRVRMSADRKEILPGAGASVSIAVANTGNVPLPGLQADVRLDMAVVTVTGAREAAVSSNQLLFTVPTLSPGERWQESFVVNVKEGSTVPAFPVTVSITGNSVISIPTSDRQSTLDFVVLSMLPSSGVNLRLFYKLALLGVITMAFGVVFGWRKLKSTQVK
jgi:hypothetical protein